MILRSGMRQEEYVQHEEELVKAAKLEREDSGTAVQWANETLPWAKAAWVSDGTHLDEKYFQQQITVVDRQMALAGLRLAKLLNDTMGKMTPRDFASSQVASSAQTPVVPDSPSRVSSDAGSGNSDIKVWVNTSSKVFHCPGTRRYGKTKNGEYMTETEAIKNGYRPVGGTLCE